MYGGGNKWEQSKALQQGAEIVVATPVSYCFLYKTEIPYICVSKNLNSVCSLIKFLVLAKFSPFTNFTV